MCIAIYKPKDKKIDDEILRNCWENNSQGAGFMCAKDGMLIVDKGYFKFKKFLKAYRKAEKAFNTDMVLHFRIATSGLVDKANCHPHIIHADLAFVHNGIFSVKADGKESDSAIMGRIFSHLPPNFIHDDHLMCLIEMASGSSKIIFMDNHGKVVIANKEYGITDDGIWYSNSGYKTRYVATSYAVNDKRSAFDYDWGNYNWEGRTYRRRDYDYYNPKTGAYERQLSMRDDEDDPIDGLENEDESEEKDLLEYEEYDDDIPPHEVEDKAKVNVEALKQLTRGVLEKFNKDGAVKKGVS